MADVNPFLKRDAAHLDATRRVKDFTRAHFRLGAEDAILVSEVACAQPGCPPLETIIAWWTEETRRHHYKVFKPLAEVTADDLPPWWMRDALVAEEIFGCPCC